MVPVIDETMWPIVTLTFGEFITLAEVGELARRLRAIRSRRGPMVTVNDINAMSVTGTTALHRRRIAEEADDLARTGALLGEAMVITNPLVRGLYLGYSWLKKVNYPSKAFGDAVSAKVWAHSLLRGSHPQMIL